MVKQKLYIIITIVITLYIQVACSTADTGSKTRPAADPALLRKTIADAEEFFKERVDDPAKLEAAVKLLSDARDPTHRNFEIEWRFAKFSYFLGKGSTDAKAIDAAFTNGREAGKIASRIEPERPDGHFWYAANLGELARRNPVTVGLRSIDDIRGAMNKVIELQPDYQNASAFDGLAQVELATRLTGGKAEKAAELLERGLALKQENAYIHLHLAETYLALKRPDDARKHLNLLLNMEPDPIYLPEYNQCAAEARKLLKTRF